eukprot:NODE_57_length_25931_cov_0.351037.p15 type:complete len:131 gc:universal NODE_57_length_25931_cov_0.351037:19200-19592(+)
MLMGRSKFLHHYMPALILKYCLYGCLFELVLSFLIIPGQLLSWQHFRRLPLLNDHRSGFAVLWMTKTPTVYISRPKTQQAILTIAALVMVIVTVSCYLYMSPMTYAFELTPEQIKQRKILSTWDFQYSAK